MEACKTKTKRQESTSQLHSQPAEHGEVKGSVVVVGKLKLNYKTFAYESREFQIKSNPFLVHGNVKC